MLLEAVYTLSTRILPPEYYIHAAVTGVAGLVTYAFAQGRTTNRERDLHARTVIITGGFTPLGLTLITSLAARGAHIIALSEYPISENSIPSLLIPVLRTTTNNEQIFAEYADLSSPESIRAFCTRFLTGEDHRLDAIVLAHEYKGIGSIFRRNTPEATDQRDTAALASFLIITLLLPKLLVAQIERDIRIVNVVNPFYAAAAPLFPQKLISILTSSQPGEVDPLFLAEGYRSLRTAVFTRHLQRVLDALPNGAPAPDPSKDKSQPAQLPKPPKMSNITALTAAPGVSRVETMSPLMSVEREGGSAAFLILGSFLYLVLYPVLWLLTKSSKAAEQTILHVLFLPTPFKRALAQVNAAADSTVPAPKERRSFDEGFSFEEVLKPGALYRECAVVNVPIPPLPPHRKEEKDEKVQAQKEEEKEEFVVLEDDGELGGESLGRMVWEWYETRLIEWEATEKARLDAEKDATVTQTVIPPPSSS